MFILSRWKKVTESVIIDGRIILKQILQINRMLYVFLPQVKIIVSLECSELSRTFYNILPAQLRIDIKFRVMNDPRTYLNILQNAVFDKDFPRSIQACYMNDGNCNADIGSWYNYLSAIKDTSELQHLFLGVKAPRRPGHITSG